MRDIERHEELAVLTAYQKAISAHISDLRQQLDNTNTGLKPDTKLPVWANGVKVGRVTRSQGGETKTSIVDESQLKAFLLAEGNATLDLVEVVTAPDWAVAEALTRAQDGENIPGIAVTRTPPQLKVFVETEAIRIAERALAKLPALEVSDAAE